uniref:Phytocyanin domain-containing protein n=1 Tax=Aegilops tauschii subsp. strangulata TaxID=200361 RepID=A0A453MIF0_AEGTS
MHVNLVACSVQVRRDGARRGGRERGGVQPYKACAKPAKGAKVYKSGADRVTLNRGTNYFICSIPGHCQSGMKIAVTAA